MIDWYAASGSFVDLEERMGQARRLSRRGERSAAIKELVAGLHNVHGSEGSWQKAARLLYEWFVESNLPREALSVAWYLCDRELMDAMFERVGPSERALSLAAEAALGLVPPQQEAELHERAAGEFERASQLVRAALSYERASQKPRARALWSRLAHTLGEQGRDPYATGLALFNLARTCQADSEHQAAREATVAAVHQLETAADHFEAIGQRERAFDCYHVLIAIGELGHGFEHVLEGSVNAIRILTEDNLELHALRMLEHGIARAEASGEFSAAATLAREMTEYARSRGLTKVADFALYRQARLWERLALAHRERGARSDLTESALRESLLAHAELAQYDSVARLCADLEAATDDDAQRERYTRAKARAAGATQQPSAVTESGLGKHVPPPEVWFDDLIEWEDAGSPIACTAGILLDPEGIDDRRTRRSALLAQLVALAAKSSAKPAEIVYEMVAQHLAPIGLYAVLPSLETLYERPEPRVRMAAIRALGRHTFKRSFITLERAIHDPSDSVKEAAVEEIRRQRFEHAFDPLARLYRYSDFAPARLAALDALAHLDLREAHELLFEALEHGTASEAQAAAQSLRESRSAHFLETARQVLPRASPKLEQALRQVARQRGEQL